MYLHFKRLYFLRYLHYPNLARSEAAKSFFSLVLMYELCNILEWPHLLNVALSNFIFQFQDLGGSKSGIQNKVPFTLTVVPQMVSPGTKAFVKVTTSFNLKKKQLILTVHREHLQRRSQMRDNVSSIIGLNGLSSLSESALVLMYQVY